MPWSSQGGGGQGPWGGDGGQGPWGGRSSRGGGGGPQPPDLEELLRRGQDRIRRFLPGGIGGGRGALILVVVAVAIWLATGFYRVQPDEQGVELVFGDWVTTTTPGLRYNWPTPVGQVYTPKVTRVNRVEVGFRSGIETTRGSVIRQVPDESLMLTGDENIIDINFVVFWIINDAGKYLFNIRNPEQTVKDAAESAMREIIGKTKFEYARTDGRAEVAAQARDLTQSILNTYESGIEVTNIELQTVNPPQNVLDAFRDVQAAAADRESAINEATAYLNEVTNRAQGQAEQIVRAAEAYKEEQTNQAEGETDRFLAIFEEYRQAEDVTKRRIYLQTMENILTNMEKVLIEEGAGGSGVLPYLPLDVLERDRSGRRNPMQAEKDDMGSNANGSGGTQ